MGGSEGGLTVSGGAVGGLAVQQGPEQGEDTSRSQRLPSEASASADSATPRLTPHSGNCTNCVGQGCPGKRAGVYREIRAPLYNFSF